MYENLIDSEKLDCRENYKILEMNSKNHFFLKTKKKSHRVQTDVDELPGDYYDVTFVAPQQPGLVATRRAAEQNDQNVAVLLLGNNRKRLDRTTSLVHIHGHVAGSHFVQLFF